MHIQNRIYIKFEIENQIDGYTSLHKRRNDGYKSVQLTVHKRLFDGCTSVESTIKQASNQRLHKRQVDVCICVESTVTIVESTVTLII